MEIFDSKDILALDGLIGKSSGIVISTHINPDGDAAGSSMGLLSYLKTRGKDTAVIFPTPLPENLEFIIPEGLSQNIFYWENSRGGTQCGNGAEAVNGRNIMAGNGQSGEDICRSIIRNADLLISVDYNSIDRAGKAEDELRHFHGAKVLIDHHLNPDTGYYDLIFSKEDISSASEAVFWILAGLSGGKQPDRETGTPLMTGMTTDTNNFANSTFPSTLEMADRLLASGVDRDGIIDLLYKRYRENRFRLLGYILSRKLTITEHGAAVVFLTAEELKSFGIRDGETEGFVNIPLEISNVRLSIFIKEDSEGHFRVSLRSKRGTSANKCSQKHFHGGGHELASGGRLEIPQDAPDADALFEYAKTSADSFLSDRLEA